MQQMKLFNFSLKSRAQERIENKTILYTNRVIALCENQMICFNG